MKKSILTLVMAALVPLTAAATNLDIVRDSNDNPVSDGFDSCLRTTWETDHDKCNETEKFQDMNCTIHKIATVFFDFDQSKLRNEAIHTVQKVYNDLRKDGKLAILHVVGHTDTKGTAKYNQALSLRRAISVQKELINLGIPIAHIKVSGKGFSELLVPTGPNVPEPQNRRVVISYSIEKN